jgi:hypothetical protein
MSAREKYVCVSACAEGYSFLSSVMVRVCRTLRKSFIETKELSVNCEYEQSVFLYHFLFQRMCHGYLHFKRLHKLWCMRAGVPQYGDL